MGMSANKEQYFNDDAKQDKQGRFYKDYLKDDKKY